MKKILFVCLGNICRSPAAEGIFEEMINSQGREHEFEVDSAATSAHHIGELADPRMREHAANRGLQLKSRARQIRFPTDFERFDHILVMDDSNLRDVLKLDRDHHFQNKIQKITDYCSRHKVSKVPDPYFGGEEGFELVLDILEDACRGFLKKTK